MADQDAQDINRMMSQPQGVEIKSPQKSKFVWIVLGCIVFGIGLGVVVYQQSIKTTVKPVVSPKPAVVTAKPSIAPSPLPSPSPLLTAVTPATNVVTPVANSLTFPEAGKLRVFTDMPNIKLVLTVTIAGQVKTITIPSKVMTNAIPMTFIDSTFEVTAGSVGTIDAYLNSTSGLKMRGWIPPTGNMCGSAANTADISSRLVWAQTQLASGKTIFSKQCWEDDDTPGEFNDFTVFWSYATTSTGSPSPSAAASSSPALSPSPSPSRAASPSPSPSRAASPSPSASVAPSPTRTPTISARVSMPDTTDGTPVTGVFEVTVGTMSVGILLLILGVFGLLVL